MGFKVGVNYNFNELQSIIQVGGVLIGDQNEIYREKRLSKANSWETLYKNTQVILIHCDKSP